MISESGSLLECSSDDGAVLVEPVARGRQANCVKTADRDDGEGRAERVDGGEQGENESADQKGADRLNALDDQVENQHVHLVQRGQVPAGMLSQMKGIGLTKKAPLNLNRHLMPERKCEMPAEPGQG